MSATEVVAALELAAGRTRDRLTRIAGRRPTGGLMWAAPTVDAMPAAIESGVDFLCSNQRPNGSLRGFDLAPGASVEWVTAHVALVLEPLGIASELRARAVAHLRSVGDIDGGWGYNRRVGVDIDSTLQALITIETHGESAPAFLHRWVRDQQRDDGSFSTYVTSDPTVRSGWHAPHPDITQMAALYFRRMGRDDRFGACLRWLNSIGRAGYRPSYWWPDPAYGLWLDHLIEPGALTTETLVANLEADHRCPQLAMTLAASVDSLSQHQLESSTLRLLTQQLADGSWPSARCLRVTDRHVHRPSPESQGRIYADPYRVFSTAHAVAALHSVLSARLHGREGRSR